MGFSAGGRRNERNQIKMVIVWKLLARQESQLGIFVLGYGEMLELYFGSKIVTFLHGAGI